MLKYSLVENQMTEREDDYSAITQAVSSIDKEGIITRMLNRGTLLTRTDILAVLNNLEETVVEVLLEGHIINTPLLNTSFSISGVFESPMDHFDGNRHKLNINLSKGTSLRDAEKMVKFEKTNTITPQPNIQEVKDSLSGTVNEVLSQNGVVEVRGYNLKIEGDDDTCGLWFVSPEGKGSVKADILIDNKPSRILAMIPYIPFGECQVRVVTQHSGGGTLLKTPRTYTYPKTLKVK